MGWNDIPLIMVMLLTVGFVWPIFFSLAADFVPGIRDAIPDPSQTTIDIFNTTSNLYQVFDYTFLIVVGGMFVFVIVTSFFVKTHPVFFMMSIVLWVVWIFLAPIMSNVWNQFASQLPNWDPVQQMPILSFVMQHYPEYVLALTAVMAVTLYIRFAPRRGD